MKKIKCNYEIAMTDEEYQELLDSLDVENSEELKGALKMIARASLGSLEEAGMGAYFNIEIEDDNKTWLN